MLLLAETDRFQEDEEDEGEEETETEDSKFGPQGYFRNFNSVGEKRSGWFSIIYLFIYFICE